ncbi:hypothetical protein [Pedobacter aquatilis]|uniref:hypothetical protein n=1 Tax=Pedobacter aquatilis TaxID=351343 RepID=UPI00292F924A|nr:hypothetical protein [Pedobacter aquatilis]
MKRKETKTGELPIEGQDFDNPNKDIMQKPSSHGEVANQKGGDFSELEESRMENPPEERETNGLVKSAPPKGSVEQEKGIS